MPDTVYVPYYDPAVVYGDWAYPAYPPYYFPPPLGYVPGAILATGIAFGAGYAVGRWASGGNYWGGGVNWGGGNINVNRPVNINNINVGSGNNWQHNPVHRQGVKYSNTNVQQKFGNNNVRAGSQDRMDFRGRSGEQVLKPGGGGKLGGDGPGNRPALATALPATGRTRAADLQPARNPARKPGAKGPAAGGGPKRDSAMGNIQSGKVANAQAARGKESLGGGGGAATRVSAGGGGAAARVGSGGGGGPRVSAGGGGGGARMGGGGGGGGRGGGGGGGGRRSDINAKHDIALIGRLDNGLGFYRYQLQRQRQSLCRRHGAGSADRHAGCGRARPGRIPAGLLREARAEFETYDHWVASGARIPSATGIRHTQIQLLVRSS